MKKAFGQKAQEWMELIKISKTVKGLFFGNGWLKEKGWLRSAQEHKIIDAQGRPLPWYSYSAVEFLKERLAKDMTVFEAAEFEGLLKEYFAEVDIVVEKDGNGIGNLYFSARNR